MPYSIMLDAGHGGVEPGAVYNGRKEKETEESKYHVLILKRNRKVNEYSEKQISVNPRSSPTS